MRPWFAIAIAPLFAALAGCQSAQVAASNPYTIAAKQYQTVYNASLTVLRDHGFRLDRTDYRFGRITTLPSVSPTIFEPWRDQNTTLGLSLESTVDELAREVTITLSPVAPSELGWFEIEPLYSAKRTSPASRLTPKPVPAVTQPSDAKVYVLRVRVMIDRRQYPTRRLTGAAGGYVFNTLAAVPPHMQQRGITAAYWLPIKRDVRLENLLLQEILRKADVNVHPHPAPPTHPAHTH